MTSEAYTVVCGLLCVWPLIVAIVAYRLGGMRARGYSIRVVQGRDVSGYGNRTQTTPVTPAKVATPGIRPIVPPQKGDHN